MWELDVKEHYARLKKVGSHYIPDGVGPLAVGQGARAYIM